MAIAYVTSGNKGSPVVNNSTTGTWAVDVSGGTGKILWISVLGDNGDNITSVTYGGSSLTFSVKKQLNSGSQYVFLYYLLNPPSGSNSLVINTSSTCYAYGMYAVYSGTSITVGSNTVSGEVASGNLALTLTTQGNNAWLVSAARSVETGAQVAGSNTTERQDYATSIGDTNGAMTPTGSYSQNWTSDGGNKVGGVAAHFYENVATQNSNFFAFF